MQDLVNVVVKEDDSVTKKIEETARRLKQKYNTKKRKVNEEKLLKGTSTVKRVFSIILDVILVIICVFCCFLGVSSLIFKINRLPPSFAGYSFMSILSGSMVADGFDIGETIVVRNVDTKTLNVGDNIAFYVYSKDYKTFSYDTATRIEKEETAHNYSLSLAEFFGIPSADVKAAAKANARLVFHKITKIYQDDDGMYWFITKGSSNQSEDYWKVSERMVIGIHDDSGFATFTSKLLQLMSSSYSIILIVGLPISILSISFVFKCIKRVQLAKLELDCIEENRKITDEICVKNNIGFNMSTKDKYKILVQAPPSKREEYISLLWRKGSAPNSIKKYAVRKNLILRPNEKLLEINRTCEKMYDEGKDPKVIAKFYLEEREKVEQERLRYKKLLKKINVKNNKIVLERK